VLPFQNVSFSYSGNAEGMLYKDLEFGIDCDSRIALVGPNGAGVCVCVGGCIWGSGVHFCKLLIGDMLAGLSCVWLCMLLCNALSSFCDCQLHCCCWCCAFVAAGKSTLLKLMLGDLEPTKGTVTRHT
jgi:ABC-type uncharacterized transport system ATPase subunit